MPVKPSIAPQLNIIAERLDKIGEPEFAALQRELVKRVLNLEEDVGIIFGRFTYEFGTVRIYDPDGVTVRHVYSLEEWNQRSRLIGLR